MQSNPNPAKEETPAQQIFKDKKILNERPEDMSYEEYKILRKIQSYILKKVLK